MADPLTLQSDRMVKVVTELEQVLRANGLTFIEAVAVAAFFEDYIAGKEVEMFNAYLAEGAQK